MFASPARVWLDRTARLRRQRVRATEVFMVWDVSFTCDICGKTKGEANHWWMLSHSECACDEEDQVPQRFSVIPWSADQSRNPEMRHLCGKGCAMQALERFMTPKVATAEIEPAAAAPGDDASWGWARKPLEI
jgi:hypothetical protein